MRVPIDTESLLPRPNPTTTLPSSPKHPEFPGTEVGHLNLCWERVLPKIRPENIRAFGQPNRMPSSHAFMLPLSHFCRKWCCGGRVTSYGRACPTKQPSPHSASRARPPWVKCGPPASCLTTTAGSRPPGPRSCWAPTRHHIYQTPAAGGGEDGVSSADPLLAT